VNGNNFGGTVATDTGGFALMFVELTKIDDVQTNTAILTEIKTMALARVRRKETPLIQVIDAPILDRQQFGERYCFR
jgi:hypothetical protein